MEQSTPHVVVLGAYGSAGAAVASTLADEDVELTLVDDGDPGGGLCILRGCMPSKEVLSAAEHRFQATHDPRVRGAEGLELDLERIVSTKDDHVAEFARHRRSSIDELTDREGVRLLRDTARFVDDRRLVVGDERIDADYVVIATGSSVNVPDLPGLDRVEYATSSDLLDATSLPDSAVVMGFGYVGLEMVPYLAQAGVDLTVVEHDARPLDEADPEYGDDLLDIYREQFGVEILTETYETRVEPTDDGGIRLHTDRDDDRATVEGDDLFLFTGRRATLEGLDLETTRLDPGHGWVTDTMQAESDPRVFVVGDANGQDAVLHVAKEEGLRAAENVLRHHRGEDPLPYERLVHHVVFSAAGVYPYARVGHTETSAREAGLDAVAVTRQASDDGVFRTKNVPDGRATLVVARDGTVLGYQGLHYHADVMAKTAQLAVEMELDVREIPARAYHPTTPEIIDGLLRDARDRLRE